MSSAAAVRTRNSMLATSSAAFLEIIDLVLIAITHYFLSDAAGA